VREPLWLHTDDLIPGLGGHTGTQSGKRASGYYRIDLCRDVQYFVSRQATLLLLSTNDPPDTPSWPLTVSTWRIGVPGPTLRLGRLVGGPDLLWLLQIQQFHGDLTADCGFYYVALSNTDPLTLPQNVTGIPNSRHSRELRRHALPVAGDFPLFFF